MKSGRMNGHQRKQAIVEAALPLFAQNGFAATTTRQLAQAAGVSEALLYKHFPSKESLYTAIKGYGWQGSDPELVKLLHQTPSTRTLILVVYGTLTRFVIGQGGGNVDWETRVRLMLHSCLEDGAFMRLIFKNAFLNCLHKVEESIHAAEVAGDMVPTPVRPINRLMFTHHVAIMIGGMHLPQEPAVAYEGTKSELLEQALWFVLRGLGLQDAAIAAHMDMERLEHDLKKVLN